MFRGCKREDPHQHPLWLQMCPVVESQQSVELFQSASVLSDCRSECVSIRKKIAGRDTYPE